MTAFFLNIPHIAEAILSRLTHADRLNCLAVNQAWHDALTPIHWQDIALFRRVKIKYTWICSDKFQLPASRKALVRYSHHTRKLSCLGPSTLSLLIASGCTQVTELCFVVENLEESVQDTESSSVDLQHPAQHKNQGLDELAQFIDCNPNLRAISIEGVALIRASEIEEVLRFVTFLDNYPGITSFHLGLRRNISHSHAHSEKALQAILEKRLDVSKSATIRNLYICRSSWRRLDRGLTVPRTKHTGIEVDVSDWRYCGDYDSRMYMHNSLAVLDNHGHLELVLPYKAALIHSVTSRLQDFPGIRSLRCQEIQAYDASQLLRNICINLRALQEIDMDAMLVEQDDLTALLQDPQFQWSSVSLRSVSISSPLLRSWLQPVWQPAGNLNFFHNVLVQLRARNGSITMSLVQQLLATCPNLQDFEICGVYFDGSEATTCLPWACRLRSLTFGLGRIGRGIPQISAANTAPSFMEQLAQQTHLQTLHIIFDRNSRFYFPILELRLQHYRGLSQLCQLDRLEYFHVDGLIPYIWCGEIEWMAEHWPRLRVLTVIFKYDVNDTYPDMDCDDYEARLMSYWPRTFPRPTIIVRPK